MATLMSKTVWLKVGARKGRYGGRWEINTVAVFSKNKPACKANEVILKLTLEVPEDLFEEPSFELKIALPSAPKKHIEHAELAKELTKVMSERMGVKVKVSMDGPTEKPFTDSLKSL